MAKAETEAAKIVASVAPLSSSEKQAVHAIGVLIGVDPASLYGELSGRAKLPDQTPTLQTGVPSGLLRRRPDVRQAERSLAAADERVRSQIALLFPSITISGQYGSQTGQFASLVDSAARFFSLSPQINWGFLNYPAAKQNVAVYKARREQQFADYKEKVLTAFRDVDDALASIQSDQLRRTALEDEVSSAERSLAVSQKQYDNGLVDLLDVLDGQRSLNNARDSLVQCQAALQTDTVSLYKALGGGWEANDPAHVAHAIGGGSERLSKASNPKRGPAL